MKPVTYLKRSGYCGPSELGPGSITGPGRFIQTNIVGSLYPIRITPRILETSRKTVAKTKKTFHFHTFQPTKCM